MSRGIVVIAVGEEYQKIADACIKVSRNFTDLPFCIIREQDVGIEVEDNRVLKLQLHKYTPFDETLFIDADSLIQKPGVEEVFGQLENSDVAMRLYDLWLPGDKVLRVYKQAMKTLGCRLPISIWQGGMWCFRKGETANRLFNVWYSFWNTMGRGRDMPSLACAVQKLGIMVKAIPPHLIAAETLEEDAVIQHNSVGFKEKFDLPDWVRWTPFDTDPTDFTWTTWEDEQDEGSRTDMVV